MQILMEYFKGFFLIGFLIVINQNFITSKELSKSDILAIPYIDILPPVVAYHTEELTLNLSLYVSYMRLEEKNSEFRLLAKLIWLVNWKDKRIRNMKDDVYYFNDGQIWTPEIHSWTNSIIGPKIKNYYTDTISVKKNGQVEISVFEDYECSCSTNGYDTVSCDIGMAEFTADKYNFIHKFVCQEKNCVQFSNSFLQMSNESNKWRLQTAYGMEGRSYVDIVIEFKRSFEYTYHILDKSPIILMMLIAIQSLIPLFSKERFKLSALTYCLVILAIINLQMEFVTIESKQKSKLQLFYSVMMILLTILWLWNSAANNLWISCNHSFKPPQDSFIGRIVSYKYLKWLLPTKVLESKSFLMKIMVLWDNIVYLTICLSMACGVIYAERLLSLLKELNK